MKLPDMDQKSFTASPASSCVLFDIVFKTIDGTEMADVEQTQKMIPFITCEVSLCQYVCELVLGVNVFDLDLGVMSATIMSPFLIPLTAYRAYPRNNPGKTLFPN